MEHASRPDAAGEVMAEYLALYDRYRDNVIRWSEGDPALGIEGVLRPQYLHLHEADIGNVRHYKMWRYLAEFVHQLGPTAAAFRTITFFHSFEEHTRLEPEKCRRERFYHFTLDTPTKTDLRAADFAFPSPAEARRGETVGRMDPIPIGPNLADMLGRTDWFQTYALGCSADDRFSYHNELQRSTPANVAAALDQFQSAAWGGYQFTIHGYTLADPAADLGPSQEAFIRMVFLMHVLMWNFDLRSTDIARHSLFGPLDRARKAWVTGKKQLDNLREAVEQAFSHIEIVGASPLGRSEPLPYTLSVDLNDEPLIRLFAKPHDFSAFWVAGPRQQFPDFWALVQDVSRTVNRSLVEFGQACGAAELLAAAEGDPAALDTWAGGIWLAYKLFTRRLQDKDGEVLLGPDQLLIALLKGLGPVKTVPVRVRYAGQGFKTREDFYKYSRVGQLPTAIPNGPWTATGWEMGERKPVGESPDPPAAAQLYNPFARWAYGLAENDDRALTPLAAAIRAGLLRNQENLQSGASLRVPGQSKQGMDASARFLGHLTRFVSELTTPLNKDWLSLKRIDLDYRLIGRTVNKKFKVSARGRVRLVCRGRKKMLQGLKNQKDGQFNTAWTGMLEALLQPGRGFQDDGKWRPGLTLCEQKDRNRMVITVTLESDRENFRYG